MIGLWWGELATSLRAHASKRGGAKSLKALVAACATPSNRRSRRGLDQDRLAHGHHVSALHLREGLGVGREPPGPEVEPPRHRQADRVEPDENGTRSDAGIALEAEKRSGECLRDQATAERPDRRRGEAEDRPRRTRRPRASASPRSFSVGIPRLRSTTSASARKIAGIIREVEPLPIPVVTKRRRTVVRRSTRKSGRRANRRRRRQRASSRRSSRT